MPGFHHWQGETLYLNIHLQPRASQDEVVGPYGDYLKIRIKSPPVDGKANQQLLKFLAREFAVPQSQVSLLSGETQRQKRVCISAPRQQPDWLNR